MKYSIKDALKYPFVNFRSLWNLWWVLVPVFGWFFIYGYSLQMLEAVIKGKDKGLPKRKGLWKNFVEGLVFIIYLIPLYAVMLLAGFIAGLSGGAEGLESGWGILVYMILMLALGLPLTFQIGQFAIDRKFTSLYNYKLGYKRMFANFGQFLLMLLYVIVIVIVWLIASIPLITILVTYPALAFGQYFLMGKLNAIAMKK